MQLLGAAVVLAGILIAQTARAPRAESAATVVPSDLPVLATGPIEIVRDPGSRPGHPKL